MLNRKGMFMDNDRRESIRKALKQEVMLSHANGFRLCQLRDISINGALLDVGWGVLTRDVPVELSLNLPDDPEHRTYHVNGHVIRVSTEGTAVRFDPLPQETHLALSQYLSTSSSW